MKDEPSPPYAHRDFDQLRLDIPEIRAYFPVLWTPNLFLMALVCSEMDTAKPFPTLIFELLDSNKAQLHFKTERIAETALRASRFWPTLA